MIAIAFILQDVLRKNSTNLISSCGLEITCLIGSLFVFLCTFSVCVRVYCVLNVYCSIVYVFEKSVVF